MEYKNMLKLLVFLSLNFTTTIFFNGCGDDNIYDMSTINNDMDDESDFDEYISDAKRSAKNESFSSAYSYLEKARELGVSKTEITNTKSYIDSRKRSYDKRIIRERQVRQEEDYNTGSSNLYIINWGYSFKTGNSIWGKNGIKLSDNSSIYTWLEKQSYGMKCYNLSVQGSISGVGSNCSNNINNYWSVSACGSSQFQIHGDQVAIVKEIVKRCGN